MTEVDAKEHRLSLIEGRPYAWTELARDFLFIDYTLSVNHSPSFDLLADPVVDVYISTAGSGKDRDAEKLSMMEGDIAKVR